MFDLFRKPDLLLIMGTSLKVHGLKRVVREFAKAVHAKKGGLVVFINLTPPSKEWEDVIDIHIQGETDAWVERVEEEWKQFTTGRLGAANDSGGGSGQGSQEEDGG